MQTRIKVLSLVFFLSFSLLVARLFYWQVIEGKKLSAQARGQQQTGRFVKAPRGNILASDGAWLAARGEAYLIYAQLTEIKRDISEIADILAPFFVEEVNEESYKEALLAEANRLKSLLSRDKVVWVPLKSKTSTEIRDNILALNIEGIGFEYEETRVYPEASSAAHLLGFVGKDIDGQDQGYFGLEGYYNMVLSGKHGYVRRDSDARGIPILLGDSREVAASDGVDLNTYLSKAIQLSLERKLAEGIEKYGASSGTAIVMDPKTGGILAAVSFPSFDPLKYFNYGDDYFINPMVSLSFEPGSIFKVVVMASALDAGVVNPDTECDLCSGPVRIDKYSIETWNKKYRPDLNMTEVIVNSDNVGMVFVSKELGSEMMYDYLEKFGFGKLTGVDLQGEMTPKLREKGTWGFIDTATASFGQGIAVTPIQFIQAVGAIANGGMMMKPKVVKSIMVGDWEENIKPEEVGRVISVKASKEITAMMVEAAEHGEAKWTYLKGFNVAGKTGTAQIPIAGHYDAEKTIASFVGFAPADDPKFVMLVILREPKSSPWASETAAPLWYSIAKDLFLYFNIRPKI